MNQSSRVYRSHAIVLSRRDHGEADRVVTLFTPALGKQEWIAKGIRKTTSRKAGHLELFTHTSLLVAKARTWDIITEAATVESFRHLRTNLESIAQASYLCELVATFTEQDDDNLPLWDLLLLALRALDEQIHLDEQQSTALAGQASPALDQAATQLSNRQGGTTEEAITAQAKLEATAMRSTLLLRWFELHLLGMSGFQPQFFTCLRCHESIKPVTNFLSLEDGGVFCPQCALGKSEVEPIESHVLKILRHLQRSSWPEIQHLSVQPLTLLAVEHVLHRYILTVLERQLKSVAFLRKLKSTLPTIG
ncbi:MAG: DNA repair protein RecO [Caldilineaceae bacterium]|nr:DNA repair protein RecO [Caldilineaceae bacterium]